MKIYEYIAADATGKTVKGTYKAKTRMDVVNFLHSQNLVVVHVDESAKIGLKSILNARIGGVPLSAKVIFTKQLSTMLSAGLPLVQALEVLANQEKEPSFKANLEDVVQRVQGGSKLSFAFSKQKGLFSDVELNLLAAGEESGNMVEMIKKVSQNLEKQKDFKGKIQGAMIYPAIIFAAVIIVVILLLTFMVPAVEGLYNDFGQPIPPTTKFLISVSSFFINFWWAVLLVIIAGIASIRYYYSTPSGRLVIDKILLNLPIFGQIVVKSQMAEFSRLLSMLLSSGIPIIDSLNIVAGALPNIHFKNALKDAVVEVQQGTPLAVPIAKNENFPMIISRMIATGEASGNLDKVLTEISKYYQTEVDQMTANLSKLLEPIILVIVGGIVAFLAVVVYSPVYNLASVIQ